MKKVRILHPWLPEYRIPFFERIIKLGKQDGIEYQIFAGTAPADSSGRKDANSSNPMFTILKTKEFKIGNRSLLSHRIDSSWNGVDLVISEYAIRNLELYKWLFFKRPKLVALWGHGRTYTKANTSLERWIKNVLARRADWFFGYTELGVKSVVEAGFPVSRTTVVQNSTDTSRLIALIQQVTDVDIALFKDKHLINSSNVAVFIGALDKSKRLDFLIESAKAIRHTIPDFQLIIFGEGPEHSTIQQAVKESGFITFGGRADLQTQAILSKVAKFIMMPGRVGLIAVDSFALGLPIVTTNWTWHAPEFEYLTHGFNSIITEDTVEDYVGSILNLLRNSDHLEELRIKCFQDSQQYTIETMAQNFHQGVLKVLELTDLSENVF